ncbi:hypothetical protein GX408_04460 [bacterium]|nr:hypothetical protein [bacterium]
MEPILFDAHVHFYPQFDLKEAFAHVWRNFAALSHEMAGPKLLLLAERSDCRFFEELAVDRLPAGYLLDRLAEGPAVKITSPAEETLFLIAGRQIVSRELLEVCALACTLYLPDRQYAAAEIVDRVHQAGGVPALNWAPGKWLFSRGKVVGALLQRFHPDELLIGDTTMRPLLWSTPRLMRSAHRSGFHILAGSDPLPFSGEEKQIGRYACRMQTAWQNDRPVASLRAALLNPTSVIERVGRRSSNREFIGRQWRIMREQKTRGTGA